MHNSSSLQSLANLRCCSCLRALVTDQHEAWLTAYLVARLPESSPVTQHKRQSAPTFPLLQAVQAGAILCRLQVAALQGPGQAVLMGQLRTILAQAAHKLQSSQSQQALLALLGSLVGPAALGWGSQTGAAGVPQQAVLQQLLLPALERAAGHVGCTRGAAQQFAPGSTARQAAAHDWAALPLVLEATAQVLGISLKLSGASAGSADAGLAGQQALGLLLMQLPVEGLLIPLAQLAGARHHHHSKPPSGVSCRLHLPSPQEQSHARRLLEASADALRAVLASPPAAEAGTPAQQQRQAALAALHRASRVMPWAAALPLVPLLACQWPQSDQVPNSTADRRGQQAVPPSDDTAQAGRLPRRHLQRVVSARTLPVLLTADLQQLLAPPSFLRLTPVFRQCLLRELASAQAHGYPAVAGRVPDTTVHLASAACNTHTKGQSLRPLCRGHAVHASGGSISWCRPHLLPCHPTHCLLLQGFADACPQRPRLQCCLTITSFLPPATACLGKPAPPWGKSCSSRASMTQPPLLLQRHRRVTHSIWPLSAHTRRPTPRPVYCLR